VVSSTPRPHFTSEKVLVPILQGARSSLGPVWAGGKSRPHRDSIPDRTGRSQSLYRLSYPAHGDLVQALRLCTGRTAHRGSRGIALLFLDHGTRRGDGSASGPGRSLPPGKTRYPLYRRLGGPQGWSGQVRKNLVPTGIRYPGRPARSQSPYRLRVLCSTGDLIRQ